MGLLYVYTIRLFAKEPVAWFSIETTIYKGESRISKIFNSKPIKHLEGYFFEKGRQWFRVDVIRSWVLRHQRGEENL